MNMIAYELILQLTIDFIIAEFTSPRVDHKAPVWLSKVIPKFPVSLFNT